MKSLPARAVAAAVAAFALQLPISHAAVTGQWDFKQGDLRATIGLDLQYLDSDTQTGAKFGTTASFGIAAINGVSTNVMFFPQIPDSSGGLLATVGASANGGGFYVNQYTVIMDVYYPTNSSGQPRTLFLTDNSGGDFMVDQNNAIGFSGGSFDGVLTPNAWHRVAVTVDTTGSMSKYIDGVQVGTAQPTPGGLDGGYSISSSISLFDDANTNSQAGYVASVQFQDQSIPGGLIAALGGPQPSGILSGPPPNPYVVSEAPTSDLRFPGRSSVSPTPTVQIVLADGVATVNTTTIQLKFNGTVVPATVNNAAGVTTISYNVTNLLAAGSLNSVALTYQDNSGHPLGAQYSFNVGAFVALPASAAAPSGSATTPGFIFRVAQAPVDATLASSLTRALQQLDGTLLDTNGVPYVNEANLTGSGSQPDGSYFVDLYEGNNGTIAFELTAAAFYQLPGLTTYTFPGIPGVNDSTDNFADETVAYLELTAGTYVFGVDVGIGRVDDPPGADDGYVLYCGANPRDLFSTVVGQFTRTGSNFGDTQNTNQFTFVAPVTGVYPFRLVHWQTHQTSSLGWYYIDQAGHQTLINDPAGSVPAFRVSTVKREPYVAEVYPTPGGLGFPATEPIKVILADDDLQVAASSIKLSLNGVAVTPTVSKAGGLTTILYTPNATRTTVTNIVQLIYADSSGTPASLTNTWSFNIVTGGASVPNVTGQWDFESGTLAATVGKDLQYFDGPTGSTATGTHFGTCSTLGIPTINGVDAHIMTVPGAISSSLAYIMEHGIAPNGGGTRVNQYTIIYDMYYEGGTLTFFNCQSTNNTTDGSLFLQGGQMGQGSGGYTMNHGNIANGWHRLAFAVDLSQNLITKWVDGVKAQDWVSPANSLDTARRAWQPTVLLFADGDGDDRAPCAVKSIQVRDGKLSDPEMVMLGAPDGSPIPQQIPTTTVTGQWDFQFGDLSATIGNDLQYFDGPTGSTAAGTQFGTCSSLGIPTIGSVDAHIMTVPGAISSSLAYIMDHGIAPNGGGTKVNQYTIIYDMYYEGGTLTFFNCQSTNNTTDGSLFLQGGQMGQGSGGYTMNHGNVTNGWHRLAFAVDLSQNLITKWVDGVKAQDWVSAANGLDTARRAWQPTVLLFADGDGDDRAPCAVKSIQVRSGKMTDAEMVALGGPDGNPIPVATPQTGVTGQWDFNFGDLSATVGKDLQYFDGPDGSTATGTHFGTCSSLSIPQIDGVDASIMTVPGEISSSLAYIMDHGIAPNGGGTRVNQYTIIYDMYYEGGTLTFFNCQSTNNTTDGSLFLQGGQMGQGSGGYTMDNGNVTNGWHRLAFAVDLSQNLITKWVDGVKAQDWVSPANALDTPRRAWQPTVLLFADGDGDDRAPCAVKSIQVSAGKLSDAAMEALGGPSPYGIPVVIPRTVAVQPVPITTAVSGNKLTLSWPAAATGFTLQSTLSLGSPNWQVVSGVVNNSVTVPMSGTGAFYRLKQ